MIRKMKTKDCSNLQFFCNKKDSCSDFYVIKNSKRVFLNDKKIQKIVFNDCLKRGDKCIIKEESNDIKGVLLVNGYADKAEKKYLKIHANNKKTIDDLLKVITWDFPTDIYVRIKKHNAALEMLLGTRSYNIIFKKKSKDGFSGYGFRLISKRGEFGNEVLLYRKYDKRFDYSKKPKFIKEGDK